MCCKVDSVAQRFRDGEEDDQANSRSEQRHPPTHPYRRDLRTDRQGRNHNQDLREQQKIPAPDPSPFQAPREQTPLLVGTRGSGLDGIEPAG